MDKRRYLTKEEIIAILNVAKQGRNGERNYCMILMAFRHGYRISELLSLKLSDISLPSRQVFIKRKKNGFSTIHPMDENEYLAMTAWLDVRNRYDSPCRSDYLFVSERRTTLSRQQAWKIVQECGRSAGIEIKTHPHMLRHACGYILASEGADTRLIQDYLGHKNIRHTVHYTKCNPLRFIGLANLFPEKISAGVD